MECESGDIFLRFHQFHGINIELQEERSVACRTDGFNNGIVFSERELEPGELFVIEIEKNDHHWAGYLRLGLTQLNPSSCVASKMKLPKDSLPHLDGSWIYSLTDLLGNTSEHSWPYFKEGDNVEITEHHISTCHGSYSRSLLKNPLCLKNTPRTIKDLEVGFKVGVVYIPTDDEKADLFYLVNGDLFGPFALKIPYQENSLYAIVDVYGITQKVKIQQIRPEQSLKQLCRLAIRKTYDMKKLTTSSLPKQIINFVNYK